MRATMNISLPESLKEWVEKQVARKGYSTASEFVRDVLRREQEEEARERINRRLDDAIESGTSTPLTAPDWRKIRAEGMKLARGRRKR
jgi:antitoxin ParD1/3/4